MPTAKTYNGHCEKVDRHEGHGLGKGVTDGMRQQAYDFVNEKGKAIVERKNDKNDVERVGIEKGNLIRNDDILCIQDHVADEGADGEKNRKSEAGDNGENDDGHGLVATFAVETLYVDVTDGVQSEI